MTSSSVDPSRSIAEKSAPHVVVILVNWNRPDETVACLKSLERIKYGNVRALVVDNGSTDNSLECIDGYARSTSVPMEVCRNAENRGFSGGCNVGIRRAMDLGAEYVWLLNNDATAEASALAAMVGLGERRPEVAVVGSVIFDASNPATVLTWGGGLVDWGLVRSQHRRTPGAVDYITGASMLLRTSVLVCTGLLDERYFMYWEDVDLCMRVRAAGFELAVAPGSHVQHKESSSVGKRSATQTEYYNESTARFLERHSSRPRLMLGVALGLRVAKRVATGSLSDCVHILRGALRGIQDHSRANITRR